MIQDGIATEEAYNSDLTYLKRKVPLPYCSYFLQVGLS